MLPFSFIYGLMMFVYNKMYDCKLKKIRHFDIPVISVGNISVGGTGKTPHIEYLVELLSKDFKIAVLSRGYKRKSKGFQYVDVNDCYTKTGDEPLQIKKKYPDITVAVNANRCKGIEKLRRDFPDIDMILLDDAFQHRKIQPSLNIVLIDYNRPVSKDSILPAGRLRDCKSSLYRADIILVTKCPNDILPKERKTVASQLEKYKKPLYFSTLEYGKECPLFQSSIDLNCQTKLSGISGIANPVPFFKLIDKRYAFAIIEKLKFPDHHDFSEKDIRIILKKTETSAIVTTEKDSVRLIPHFNGMENRYTEKLFYIPIKVKVFESQKFNSHIIEHVRKSKTDSRLY
jgi:tetraacyldisaccharide 4'-kinase